MAMNNDDAGPKIERVNNFDQLYAGRFLKAGDLDGKKVTLTIADAWREELKGSDGTKMKVTMSFEKTSRQIVACKTNGLCIKAMFGPSISDWKGKRITLFASEWNGEPCIRVWGSPDIEHDMKVTIQLPRKRPIEMTMHKVGNGKPAGKTSAKTETTPSRSEEYSDPGPPDDFESREPGTEG